MAFTGSFSKTNQSSLGLNFFKLTDDSSYADEPKNDFSDRYFYLVDSEGNYIQSPEGTDKWDFGFAAYSSDERQVQVLTEDIALTVYMVWVPITPVQDSTYTATEPFDFLDYANYYKYNTLIASMAANKTLVDIKNFLEGIFIYQTLLQSSNRCIANIDPYASQQCINQLVFIQNNPNLLN